MLASILRGLPRMIALFLLGLAFLTFSVPFARTIQLPEVSAPLWFLGWAFIVALVVDVVRRIMMPGLDYQETAKAALQGNVGAGLVLLATAVFLAAFVIASAGLVSQ